MASEGLTEAQRRILQHLARNHAYVSASEAAEAEALQADGYVKTWSDAGGFLAWTITAAGRRALASAKTREG